MDIEINVSGIELETDRLVLREWREDDADDMFEYASVPGVGEMAGWKHHESVGDSRRILSIFMEGKNVFAVESRDNGRVIGSLGLHTSWAGGVPEYAGLKMKEIGYVLAKPYWGRGLMPEAVTAVIRYCFDACGLDALTVGHFVANAQSRRVIEKCGFTFVKKSEYYSKQLDLTFDDIKYIMFK
ncbi:MAG: GNAT family N-acetyltransferase [Oscillospiraceae bacterium]|nr:GNAT family N-acetyltransferase [Oscillospiraceae bacterium]